MSEAGDRHPADEAYAEVVEEFRHDLDVDAVSLELGAKKMRERWKEADSP